LNYIRSLISTKTEFAKINLFESICEYLNENLSDFVDIKYKENPDNLDNKNLKSLDFDVV